MSAARLLGVLVPPLALAWAWGHWAWLDPLAHFSMQGLFALWGWVCLPLLAGRIHALERVAWGIAITAWLWTMGWALDAGNGMQRWPWSDVLVACSVGGASLALSGARPVRGLAWSWVHLLSITAPVSLALAAWAGRPVPGRGEAGEAWVWNGAARWDGWGPGAWAFERLFTPEASGPSSLTLFLWTALGLACAAIPGRQASAQVEGQASAQVVDPASAEEQGQ